MKYRSCSSQDAIITKFLQMQPYCTSGHIVISSYLLP